MDKLERLKKYANGGKVAKFQNPAGPLIPDWLEDVTNSGLEAAQLNQERKIANLARRNYDALKIVSGTDSYLASEQMIAEPQQIGLTTTKLTPSVNLQWNNNKNQAEGNVEIQEEEYTPGIKENQQKKELLDVKGNAGWKPTTQDAQMMGGAAVAAINMVDGSVMGDKNFSAGSKAIDTGVHIASGAMIKSGNPWAIGAAVALEGLNFATKAGGKNVPGYNVNIDNSGYGNLGHQDSEAGRVWDNWSGAINRKLARRNEQARMALAAADISEDQRFEQEARANSVTNVLEQNKIALAGGIDTSLLGS